jgi:hypothetical protein
MEPVLILVCGSSSAQGLLVQTLKPSMLTGEARILAIEFPDFARDLRVPVPDSAIPERLLE